MNRLIIHGYEACTVGELIAHLREFPAETPVIYEYASDHSPLQTDEVGFCHASSRRYVVHNNGVIRASGHGNMPDEKYVSVVVFPGN